MDASESSEKGGLDSPDGEEDGQTASGTGSGTEVSLENQKADEGCRSGSSAREGIGFLTILLLWMIRRANSPVWS